MSMLVFPFSNEDDGSANPIDTNLFLSDDSSSSTHAKVDDFHLPRDDDNSLPTSFNAVQALLQEQDAHKRRLSRKAELARLSRRKKKMRLEELASEVDSLRQQLEVANRQLSHHRTKATMTSSDTSEDTLKESARLEAQFVDAARNKGTPPAALQSLAVGMCEHFRLGTGQLATDAARLHARSALKLAPLPVRFLEWIVQKDATFFAEPSGVWESLRGEIGVSSEQMAKIAALPIAQLHAESASALALAADLSGALQRRHDAQNKLLADLAAVLEPQQLATLLTWVYNSASILKIMGI